MAQRSRLLRFLGGHRILHEYILIPFCQSIRLVIPFLVFFFLIHPAPPESSPLPLHAPLPTPLRPDTAGPRPAPPGRTARPTAPGPIRPAQLPCGVGGFVGRVASSRQVLDTARTATADTG